MKFYSFRDQLKEKLKNKQQSDRYFDLLKFTRISAEISEFRKQRGLTQEELAEKINSSQPTIARIEAGNYFRFSLRTLTKIANALELELVVHFRERVLKAKTSKNFCYKEHLSLIEEEDPYKFDVDEIARVNNRAV